MQWMMTTRQTLIAGGVALALLVGSWHRGPLWRLAEDSADGVRGGLCYVDPAPEQYCTPFQGSKCIDQDCVQQGIYHYCPTESTMYNSRTAPYNPGCTTGPVGKINCHSLTIHCTTVQHCKWNEVCPYNDALESWRCETLTNSPQSPLPHSYPQGDPCDESGSTIARATPRRALGELSTALALNGHGFNPIAR